MNNAGFPLLVVALVAASGLACHLSGTEDLSTANNPAETVQIQDLEAGIRELASRHRYQAVKASTSGEGNGRYYIFEPVADDLLTAPVVLFNHGWGGMNPLNYGVWIEHLVLQGIIVIFPVYQTDTSVPPRLVTKHAIDAFRDALGTLKNGPHIRPNLDKVVAIGFSMGATISINIASGAAREGLPPIRGVLLANPGDARHVTRGDEAKSIVGDMSKIPGNTIVITVVGDSDKLVGDRTATDIGKGLCAIPADRRPIYVFHTAGNGSRTSTAGHGAPGAPHPGYDFGDAGERFTSLPPVIPWPTRSESLNNFDVFGYWRLADAMIDTVLFGRPALPSAQTGELFMGTWPDGTAFTKATIADDPCGAAKNEQKAH